MNLPRNIALFINPIHQKALRVGNELSQLLQQKGLEHTVFSSDWPSHLSDFSEAWVVGGDGTLNYFLNHFPQVEIPIAIFKGGTGNDFHWMLYGDIPLGEQVEKVLAASPKRVDAGYCNNHLFINGVGIGLDGKVVQDLLGKRKWNGKLSYYAMVLRNIFFFREFLCTIHNKTFHWGKKCLMISIANGRRCGGGFYINPTGQVNDRQLDINIVGHLNPLLRLLLLSRVEKGKHANLPMVTYLKTGNIHIKTGGIIPAHADGEYFDASEFVIECLPARFSFLY
jgi:YegS/Rv2252/BmrU family lipid kinase